jgi:hypothetical protein
MIFATATGGTRKMHIYAYIRVLSNETTIRALHNETNVPRANIEQLKARGGEDELLWNWQTEQVPIDVDNPDDGLNKLLRSYRAYFPTIRKTQAQEADIYLGVVAHYEKGDEPRGLYLSAETVALLSEMGGALDNDVYSAD